MRTRRLFERTRPFRYAGFYSIAAICLLLALHGGARSPWQTTGGALLCVVWPPLADRLQRRLARATARADDASAAVNPARLLRALAAYPGARDAAAYAAECALAATLFAWASLPPAAATAGVLCLLAGALALGGAALLLPSVTAAAAGGVVGLFLAPVLSGESVAAADAVALVLMFGFGTGVAHLAFRQTRRLDDHRLALARRSAELERLTARMERYLPPSLRARLAAAPEAPCRWERRWLTVVFVDLVGFTALADRLDAEPLARLLDEYLAELAPAAERHGGEISKVMGDGVLVVFGAAAEGGRRARASAALDFCRQVPASLDSLAQTWRGRGELVVLEMRAGVASGYCTVGDRGGADRLDFTLVGTPVNLASRLQSLAPPGGALVDAATAALAAQAADLAAPEPLEIKGLGRVQARALTLGYRVDPPAPSAMVPAPLVHPSRDFDGKGLSARLPRRADAVHADLAESPGRTLHARVPPGEG